jgi:hypothetical protein
MKKWFLSFSREDQALISFVFAGGFISLGVMVYCIVIFFN